MTAPLPEAVSPEVASELLGWLLAQSAALVVSMLWVVSMLIDRRQWRAERAAMQSQLQTCHERNVLLSDWLVRSIEGGCAERSRRTDNYIFRIDTMVRSWQDLLTRALDTALTSPESSRPPSGPGT